jgi:signal transduction histidine kinase
LPRPLCYGSGTLSRISQRSQIAERRFPTLGVVLMGVVVLLASVREFALRDPAEPMLARPGTILIGVLLDILFLAWLARKLDAARWRAAHSFSILLALSSLLGIAYLFAVLQLGAGLGIDRARELGGFVVLRVGAMWGIQTFALWMLGFRYPQVAREAALGWQESERLRQEAELIQLRGHLQPHFLRNTLNAIAALVSDNPTEARRLLATLADLLSESLESVEPVHTLDEELTWLRRYTEILTTRFQGSLSFAWDVSQDMGQTVLPTLLLQPLVENAVFHGALSRDGAGEVAVRARACAEGGVEIIVEDNGPGIRADWESAPGFGLRLVRRRLELECPNAEFTLRSSPQGTRASVRFT